MVRRPVGVNLATTERQAGPAGGARGVPNRATRSGHRWWAPVRACLADRRFWATEGLLAGVLVLHLGADLAQDRGLVPVPGFVWILFVFVPLVYAGSVFGLVGALGVALEAAAVLGPEELLTAHSATELWGAWSILATAIPVALLLGDRFNKGLALRDDLLTSEHLRTAGYYEGHPLFGEHLLGRLPDGVAVLDEHGVICYVNAPLVSLTGYSARELIGEPVELLVPARFRGIHAAQRLGFAKAHGHRPTSANMSLVALHKDGREVPVDIAIAPYGFEGRNWAIATVRDDTAPRAAEEARRRIERRFELAFANNVAGMLVVDLGDRVLAVNDSFCQMVGRPAEEILGETLAFFTLGEDQGIAGDSLVQMLAGKERATYTKRYLHKDGHVVFAEVSRSLVRDETGNPEYFVTSVRDVTTERELKAKLSHDALHDPLTGLANRALFEDRLAQALARSARDATCTAVLLIDLDSFKEVNDTFGHEIGDELLVAVARRLESATRAGDTVCRFGGDEFLYLAAALAGPGSAEQVAERILHLFDKPFHLGLERLDQRASIGLATGSGEAGGPDLVRDADTALYDAKARGGLCYAVFRPEMHDVTIHVVA